MPISLTTPVKDYDDTLIGELIRFVENPDSVGFENGRWYSPKYHPDYDPNNPQWDKYNFGMGCMAYAMTQEAKRRGISTDELVDMYTVDGDIMGEAPQQLQDLSIVYSPENMKKFLKGFLSVTAPVAMGLNIVEDGSR